jgi:hypothetical protein
MWEAELDDGTTVSENDGQKWSEIKDQVVGLSFTTPDGKNYSLPSGQKRYMRATTGSFIPANDKISIESRWIGFETYSGETFRLRFHEKSGNISVETS